MADSAPEQPPEGLVYEEQALRFHLRGIGFAAPTAAGADGLVEEDFGVLVANEYGLWRKADLGSICRRLRLSLAGPGKDTTTLTLVHCEDGNRLHDGSNMTNHENTILLELNENAKMQATLKLQLRGGPVVLQAELVEQGARHVENVCSMPIFPASWGEDQEALACMMRNAPEARQCRMLHIPTATGAGELFVAEAPAYLGIGGKIWDAAWEIMRWLAEPGSASEGIAPGTTRMEHWVRGHHVLELGSGTGSMALALGAAAGPASMTMTDLPEVVQLLEFNVALNQCLAKDTSRCVFRCASIPWGDAASAKAVLASGVNFTTVILCDLIYEACAAAPLVSSLVLLCPPERREEQQALLAYRHRHDECKILFTMLDEHFEVSSLPGLTSTDVQFFRLRRK